MLIVYPDVDPSIKRFLTDDATSKLKTISEFRFFEGKPKNTAEFLSRVQDADGILLGWHLPNEVLSACSKLKIVSFTGIGANNFIDLNYANRLGVKITNTPGYADNTVAEHAFSLLLSLAKNIPKHNENVINGIWDQSITSMELAGKTIGLIGLGGIGKRMAEICNAFRMNVKCWTFNPSEERAQSAGVSFVSLDELLRTSDVISLHIPLTEETRNFLTDKELSTIKQGAILINTARAEIIDTNSLVKHLSSGRLRGAGIDVFEEEPLSIKSPLLTLDNVILTPHIGFNTEEATKEILNISINNLFEFFNGNPINVLN